MLQPSEYKVSILVPFYNVAPYIERCARTLLEQTYHDIEYIFINDCSTDNSLYILENLLLQYPDRRRHTIIINNGENKGVASNRNIAIRKANGEFVCHVDADDWLEIDAIEQLVTKQMENDADIVYGNACMHTTSGTSIISEPDYPTKHDMLLAYSRLTPGYTMVLWRRLIRKSLYFKHNIWNIDGYNYAEDKLTISQLAYWSDRYAHLDNVIYHYNRLNETSLVAIRQHKESLHHIKQELGNIQAIEDFFHTHNETYFQETVKAKLIFIKNLMDEALNNQSKTTFRFLIQQIHHTDPAFYPVIGWKTNYKKRLYSNYYYMRFSPIVKRIIRKILKQI